MIICLLVQETSSLIATALDKLGNRQPQKFADLSAPACAPSGVSKSYENGNTQLVTSHVMNILWNDRTFKYDTNLCDACPWMHGGIATEHRVFWSYGRLSFRGKNPRWNIPSTGWYDTFCRDFAVEVLKELDMTTVTTTMIWLVEWGKIILLHVQHALKSAIVWCSTSLPNNYVKFPNLRF